MVNLHRLILWFAAFLSFAASAAFPLPSVYQYRGQDYSTAQAACAAYIAYIQPSNPTVTLSVGGITEYSATAVCRINASSSAGSWVDNVAIGKYTGSCPVGSVQSGSSCTCSEGYKENGFGDGCVQINHDREDCFNFSVSGQMPGGDLAIDYRYSGSVADGSKFCVGVEGMANAGRGCTVTFNRTGLLDYGGGKIVSEGNLSMAPDSNIVDQSCALNPSPPDPTKKPEPPGEKCKNGYTGQVNGVTVCVTKVPDSGVGDDSKETVENDGTDTKKTKTDSRTECKNGVCTTTTTTTTTTTNNSTGASTTTSNTTVSTQGQKGFCA